MTVHYFTLESKILIELSFTLDLTGSEDIMIENSQELVMGIIIGAESAETVAIVKEFPHSRLHW